MPFFILFVLIPLAEIMVFMAVSDRIGLGTALLAALFTAIIGGTLVKYQGLQTMMSAQDSLRRGALPSKELFDGLCLVAAGATLITPGFITDVIGFALLVPQVRDYIRVKMGDSAHFEATGFHAEFSDYQNRPPRGDIDENGVIEAEYETVARDDSHDEKS